MPDKKKQKKPKKKVIEYWTYVVEIMDWELTYSFSLTEREEDKLYPYSEFLHLEIKGLIKEPAKYAGLEMDATIMGDRDILPDKNDNSYFERKPLGVGSLNLRGEYRKFLGFIPFDTLPILSEMLDSKNIQYFYLHGPKPHYGSTIIQSIHFYKKRDPDDE
jgi:hypothetical protein